MTIANEDSRTGPYNGNDSTTVFAYDFKTLDEDHLVVTLTSAAGVDTVQTITTHYTVSGVGDEGGGNVTMVTAPASGEKLTITRSVPLTQGLALQNRRATEPATLETAYDKGVQISQDLKEVQDRTLKFTVAANLTSFDTTIPAPAASKAIAINATNDGFTLVDEPSAAAAAAAVSAAAAAVSETNAATSETNAATIAATLTGATSTTSLVIGTGAKVFTVASGLGFQDGDWVLITSDADPDANYMHGPITTYTGTTMTVGVDNIGGSGTLADWTIRRSGTRGAGGATGATGPAGSGDVVGPASATDSSLARFDGTTGKLLKDGAVIGTDVQAYDADTVKKDVANVFTAQQTPLSAALTYNATQTWDCGAAQDATLTLTGNVTTFSAPTNQVAGSYYVLRLNVGTGPYSVSAWNSAFKWPAATAPTLSAGASDIDILTFRSDGTNMELIGLSQDVS